MALHADRQTTPEWTSPRVVSTVAGGAIASIGASALSAGTHSTLLALIVIGIGLVIVFESLADGSRPLRTWGIVLAAVGLTATVGPFAATLSAGSAAGPMYLAAGVAAALVPALRRAA
jgi:hypothetical protein